MTNLLSRNACKCRLCVNEPSGQKTVATCDIPLDLKIDRWKILEYVRLEVFCTNDVSPGGRHLSTHEIGKIHETLMPSPVSHRHIQAREIWDVQYFELDSSSREISYNSWMEDDSSFAEGFRNVCL